MKVYGNIFMLMQVIVAAVMATACGDTGLTRDELRTIESAGADGIMRVLTVYDKADSLVLRTRCTDFPEEELDAMFTDSLSPCARLAAQMVATVTSPEQDGVGIAGPQVGICRRIVAVQRFDKEGEPFEVYPDIRILEARGSRRTGPEGCLSIPGRRGLVERWDTVVISYAKVNRPVPTELQGGIPTSAPVWTKVTETVGGFTAVIFQHECDHLDGILYTDRQIPQPEM